MHFALLRVQEQLHPHVQVAGRKSRSMLDHGVPRWQAGRRQKLTSLPGASAVDSDPRPGKIRSWIHDAGAWSRGGGREVVWNLDAVPTCPTG